VAPAAPVPSSPGEAVVTVRYWAAAAHATELDEELLGPVGSVGAALEEALGRHPALADVLPACSVLVDGLVVAPGQGVLPGMIIEVLPPFAGG
jgi:molybdopterin converting factor small subunit